MSSRRRPPFIAPAPVKAAPARKKKRSTALSFATYVEKIVKEEGTRGIVKDAKITTGLLLRVLATRIIDNSNILLEDTDKETVKVKAIEVASHLTLPVELAKAATAEANSTLERFTSAAQKGAKREARATRAGLTISVSRPGRLLHRLSIARRISAGAPVYLAAILEYVARQILNRAADLAGSKGAKGEEHNVRITVKHIFSAIRGDRDLNELFEAHQTIIGGGAISKGNEEAK